MQKARAFSVIMLLFFMGFHAFNGSILHAQEEDSDDEEEDITIESDWITYMPDLYARGDQIFSISAGVIFPAVFFKNGEVVKQNFSPPVGGMVPHLAYYYFLGSHFFLGGEIGIQFNSTIAKNTIFIFPIGLRLGWQSVFRHFEFPLGIGFGFVRQQYLDKGYSGIYINGKVSAFYRFNSDWSFGLNTDWSWYPQRPQENGKPASDKNMDGNIIGLTLSARYHF